MKINYKSETERESLFLDIKSILSKNNIYMTSGRGKILKQKFFKIPEPAI